jgi:hypothetical protein
VPTTAVERTPVVPVTLSIPVVRVLRAKALGMLASAVSTM